MHPPASHSHGILITRGRGAFFGDILAHLQDLQGRGSPWSYFLYTTKSILIVSPRNVSRLEALLRGIGLNVVTGNCYLGGFIGDQEAEATWLEETVEGWTTLVQKLLEMAHQQLQTAHAGM